MSPGPTAVVLGFNREAQETERHLGGGSFFPDVANFLSSIVLSFVVLIF